jgi:amidase
MARTVLDTAALLEAIAGYDGLDDRQLGAPAEAKYVDKLLAGRAGGIKGMKIGVLVEAMELEALAPSVKKVFLLAVERLKELGAEVQEVSIPL